MIVVVIVLGVVAVVVGALLVTTRGRLAEQTRLTAVADLAATQRAVELEDRSAALQTAEQQRAAALEAAAAAVATAEVAAHDEAEARAAAAAADEAREVARSLAAAADTARGEAEQRADAADARAAEASAVGLDPHVLWALERQRVDRTWRFSVAIGPETRSVFDDVEHPLVEALRVEAAATREEAGTIVELDVDLPVAATSAGSLLTLRAAQELLATVVRLAEHVMLTVRADGNDITVVVDATDEHGDAIVPAALDMPPTLGLIAIAGGVRVVGAVADRAEPTT